jgi:hypothetical protein
MYEEETILFTEVSRTQLVVHWERREMLNSERLFTRIACSGLEEYFLPYVLGYGPSLRAAVMSTYVIETEHLRLFDYLHV